MVGFIKGYNLTGKIELLTIVTKGIGNIEKDRKPEGCVQWAKGN